MKILILTTCLTFIINVNFSQEKIDLFSKFITQSIGINQITKDSIYAKEVYFEYYIKDHSYDSIYNTIIVKLLYQTENGNYFNEGMVSSINLDSSKLNWSNIFSYKKVDYQLLEDNLIIKNKKDFFSINPINQDKKWRLKSFVINPNDINNDIGVTIEQDDRITDKYNLIGINIKTGEKFWESELLNQKKFFISNPVRHEDQFYFINTQFNSINLKTGKTNTIGKDFEVNTGKSNSGALIAGYLLGGVIGYAIVNSLTTEVEYTHKSYSNLFLLDSFYYIANSQNIYKLNNKNEIVKEIRTPNNDQLVNPEFYYHNNHLYLINKGRPNSIEYNSLVKYDLNLEIQRSEFVDYESIIDVIFNDSFSYILQNSSYKKLNLFNNNSITLPYKDKNYISAKSLFDSVMFYEDNKTITQINIFNSDKFYLKAAKEDSISAFDLNMKLLKKYSIFRFSKLIYKNDKLKFIQNKGECFILNNENKLILELPNIEKLIYRNKKYYISLDNQIMIIDENQLVK